MNKNFTKSGKRIGKKPETNEQKFKELFNDLHTIEVALLRERLTLIMKMTVAEVKKNPKAFDTAFTNHKWYLDLAAKVEKHLGFGNM